MRAFFDPPVGPKCHVRLGFESRRLRVHHSGSNGSNNRCSIDKLLCRFRMRVSHPSNILAGSTGRAHLCIKTWAVGATTLRMLLAQGGSVGSN